MEFSNEDLKRIGEAGKLGIKVGEKMRELLKSFQFLSGITKAITTAARDCQNYEKKINSLNNALTPHKTSRAMDLKSKINFRSEY